jgi:hypothetical protein
MPDLLFLEDVAGGPLTPAQVNQNMREVERRTGAGWRDYPFIISPVEGSLYSPTWEDFEDGYRLPAFGDGGRTDGQGFIHLDHDFILSMVYPHIHWTTTSNAAGVVRWLIKWKFARRADSPTGIIRFTSPETIVVEHSVAENSAGFHLVSEPATGSGIYHPDLDVDAVIMLLITRDAGHVNDTFPASALIEFGDAHARIDKIGTKGRTPPFLTDV